MAETQPNAIFWKPEVSERGTFNIVITCFTTLGICLWSSLHLSIPQRRRSWKGNLGVKLGWMIITLFLPEWLIMMAAEQRLEAARLRDAVNTHFHLEKPRRPWYKRWFVPSPATKEEKNTDKERLLTRGSSNFRDSTSLCSGVTSQEGAEQLQTVDEKPITKLISNLPFPRSSSERHRWTLAHGFYAVMGGYASYGSDGELGILESAFIRDLLKQNPELIPDLSEHTILDKSKADGLAKTILFAQIGWFCVSSINRLAQGYPLAILEVSTLAHALCSMAVYVLWWDKPLNIQEPLIIFDSKVVDTYKLSFRSGNFDIEGAETLNGGFFLSIFVGIGFIYGGPHLLAWNSEFATHTEQLLWRIASCIVSSFGAFCAVSAALCEAINNSDSINWDGNILFILLAGVPCFLAYIPASLYLIAGSLRQLFYLPPAAFQIPAWTNYFPHFS